ncbi:polymerase PA [Araguari virus]|uniref:Polymerase PA n=1 Tax=Araguari virus TaxID=352236 RepID=A0A343FNE2_9ORTO|nr:polymerase PA [Araguari virus]ASR92125.1 polymerase PA [Araguari virus]
MAFDQYLHLILNTELYPASFRELAGEQSEHWARDNYKQREESLRHDQVCALLMNTVPAVKTHTEVEESTKSSSKSTVQEEEEKRFDPMEVESLVDKGRQMYAESVAETASHLEEQESDSESGEEEDEFGFMAIDPPEVEVVEEDIEELLVPDLIDSNYRYTLLEGVTGYKHAQVAYTEVWGIKTYGKWDLIDRQKRKLIEVKVTTRGPHEVWEEIQNKCNQTDPKHYGAWIVFDDSNGGFSVYTFGEVDPPPGWKQAEDFLIRRYNFMQSMGMTTVAGTTEDRYPVWDISLMNKVDDWVKPLWQPDSHIPPSDEAPRLHAFNLKKFRNLLEDPRLRECEESAKWVGKVLPDSWAKNMPTSKDKDIDLVETVLNEIDFSLPVIPVNWNLQKAERLKEAVHGFCDSFKRGFADRNSYIPVKKGKKGWFVKGRKFDDQIKELLSEVGIGWKPYRNTGIAMEGMKQEDVREIKKRRWDDWMTELIKSESQPIDGKAFADGIFEEAPTYHTLDSSAQKVCKQVYELFRGHKVGATCSKIMNFYSRMGGTYLRAVTGKAKHHSSMAILPLYYKVREGENEGDRMVSGFVIRGPHHLRDSTDTMNLIVAERTSLTEVEAKRRLQKGFLMGDWFIRKNAIRKADSTYLTFLHNALFVPTNFLGELVTNHPRISEATVDPNFWDVILAGCFNNCNKYHLDRVVETVLMGVLGRSQEEGYHDMLRKVYMLLMALGRGDIAQVMDVDAMAEEMNECLIDSAYVMWTHCELLNFLDYVTPRHPFNVNNDK